MSRGRAAPVAQDHEEVDDSHAAVAVRSAKVAAAEPILLTSPASMASYAIVTETPVDLAVHTAAGGSFVSTHDRV